MRKLSKDDQANLRLTVHEDKSTVAVTHTVKPDGNSPVRFELTWTLDFKNATKSQLLEWAAKTVKIQQQAVWRKDPARKQADRWDNVTFDAVKIMATERKTTDPTMKALKAVEKMTAEEKADFLKLLQK